MLLVFLPLFVIFAQFVVPLLFIRFAQFVVSLAAEFFELAVFVGDGAHAGAWAG